MQIKYEILGTLIILIVFLGCSTTKNINTNIYVLPTLELNKDYTYDITTTQIRKECNESPQEVIFNSRPTISLKKLKSDTMFFQWKFENYLKTDLLEAIDLNHVTNKYDSLKLEYYTDKYGKILNFNQLYSSLTEKTLNEAKYFFEKLTSASLMNKIKNTDYDPSKLFDDLSLAFEDRTTNTINEIVTFHSTYLDTTISCGDIIIREEEISKYEINLACYPKGKQAIEKKAIFSQKEKEELRNSLIEGCKLKESEVNIEKEIKEFSSETMFTSLISDKIRVPYFIMQSSDFQLKMKNEECYAKMKIEMILAN